MAKVEACRTYGSELILEGERFEDAMAAAMADVMQRGATFIHPFEDPLVIAGQGTIGLELAEQVADAETVVIPVGGGGLASGIAIALRDLRPDLIVGVQAGLGLHDRRRRLREEAGRPGLCRSSTTSSTTWWTSTTRRSARRSSCCSSAKLVVEGAGAVGVAALLAGKVGGSSGPVAIVLSGGNIDPSLLISVMRHGLTVGGRYLVVRTRVPDRPGELVKLLTLIAEERVTSACRSSTTARAWTSRSRRPRSS